MCSETSADYDGTGHGVGDRCVLKSMQTVMKHGMV